MGRKNSGDLQQQRTALEQTRDIHQNKWNALVRERTDLHEQLLDLVMTSTVEGQEDRRIARAVELIGQLERNTHLRSMPYARPLVGGEF